MTTVLRATHQLAPNHSKAAIKSALLRTTISFLTLTILLPLLVWNLFPYDRNFDTATALSLAIILIVALRLTALALRGEARLLAITFYVFIYVWGGVAAFAQNYTGIFPWMIRHDADQAYLGVLQIALSLFAYEAGQLLARRRRIYPSREWRLGISQRAVLWIGVAALPLLLLGMLILGGPDILFASRADYNAAVGRGVGSNTLASLVGSSLFRAPAFVAFMLALAVLKRDWRQMTMARRRLFLALFLYCGLLAFIGNFPLSLPRQWLGVVLLTPVFALLPWRRWQVSALSVGLVLAVLLVFPYADALRKASSTADANAQQVLQATLLENLLNKGDFDVYQQSLNAIVVTEQTGFVYGRNFLGAATFWLPRKLWPDKPIGTGVLVATLVGYPWYQTNLSAPLWMEAYWAFGWFGIALIIGGYGYLCGRLDGQFLRDLRADPAGALSQIAVPFLASYQFILIRGDILNGTAQAAPVILLLLLAAQLRRGAQGTANG